MKAKDATPRPSVPGPRASLAEAEEILRAIQGGAVDAFVVRTRHGDRVFTLQGADYPYRVLVEQMEEGAATMSRDGTILYANRCFATLLRTALELLIGASIYQHISPADQPAVHALLKRRQTGAHRIEATIRAADGTSVPVTLTASYLRTGGVGTVCLIVTDLTNRKRAEENARQHHAKLSQVLRLSALGELAAEFANGINQPLTAVVNDVAACVTYVQSGKAMSRDLLALLEHAATEALDAGDIVHRMVELAQKRETRLEAADLNGLVRNVARLLEPEIVERGIKLQLDLAPRSILVRVDRIDIEQVLVNLVQNAIDAACEVDSERKQIHVQTGKTEDAMAEVTVHDIGKGLSDAAPERLFEAFFTTKAQGLGMGLAISRSIVEAHQGRIWLDRPAGDAGGTTVRFALPLQHPKRRPRAARS